MDSTYNTMPNTTDAEISDNINSMLMSIIETIIDNIVTAGRMETSSPTCDNSSPVTVAEGRNNDDNINDDNKSDRVSLDISTDVEHAVTNFSRWNHQVFDAEQILFWQPR